MRVIPRRLPAAPPDLGSKTSALIVLAVLAAPSYDPNGSSAPGKAVVQELLNTVAFFCSALALAAFAAGAATWGIGGRLMHSAHGGAMGKMTMLAAAGGAVLLGAGPAIIAWAIGLGGRA
jgi:hypothetical protein